ncbi:MAG TPA: hypothetical protein VG291_14265 [Xanthobacteraceae bacterium]|nr:hypothetical protein [Xanthobacteraceae bacterium]
MTALDQFTLTTVPLEQYFGETRLGQGTGFMWKIQEQYYLVTAWHVLAMRDFFTGKNLRDDAGWPNTLRTLFNIQTGSFDKQRWDITIRDADNRPLWLVHPGRRVDIAVLPIPFRPKELIITLYPLNVLANAALRIEIGMEVFILGYPFEIKPPAYPVWKRGSIASAARPAHHGLHARRHRLAARHVRGAGHPPELVQSHGGARRGCPGGHAPEQVHRGVFRPGADRPSA